MRRIFFIWFCIGIAFVAGCIKSFNPVAPTWDVTVNVPVANRVYTLQDIINNNPSLFSTSPNGVFLFSTSTKMKPTAVGTSLTIADDNIPFQSGIRAFPVKDASTTSDAVSLGRAAPGLGPVNGIVSDIPETQFQFPAEPMPNVSQFREVTVSGGTLTVEVTNNLPTAINNLKLVFFDQARAQHGDLVSASFPGTIQPHQSDSLHFDLSNKTIGNIISYSIEGVLQASGTPVLIDTSSRITVRLRFSDVTVVKAEAQIPEIDIPSIETIELADSSTITRAEIKSGQLSIQAKIPFTGAGDITFQIQNLTAQNGKPFRQEFAVMKNQSMIDTTFFLDGYVFSATDRQIHYTLDTRIYDSGNDYVAFDASDSIAGTVTLSKITLRSFEGSIKPTDVAIERDIALNTKAINKLIGGTVRYTDASLVMHFETPPGGFEYDLSGSIIGRNRRTGITNSLPIPSDHRVKPGIDSIVFASADLITFLNGFSPNLPDSVSLKVTARINPAGTQQGVVHDTDSFAGLVHFELPFHLSITGGIYRDTLSFSSSSDNRNQDINNARLNLELENALPTALGVDSLKFLDKKQAALFILPKQGQPAIAVQSGIVTGGVVTQTAKSTSYIELNNAEASLLDSCKSIVVTLHLETPTAEAVVFRSTDWVRFYISSTINYRANK